MHHKINIAIDGPAASGKSAAGALLAKKINYDFMDTGIMYRSFTWWCLKTKIPFSAEDLLVEALNLFEIKWINHHFLVNNQLISDEIYSSTVTDHVPTIAVIPAIRKIMVAKIQAIVATKGFIVVGRDITSVVLPAAQLKIFLTSNLKTRSIRRWTQYRAEGINIQQKKVAADLALRDQVDETRLTGQLKIVDDAIIVDNSDYDLTTTVTKLLNLYQQYLTMQTNNKDEINES